MPPGSLDLITASVAGLVVLLAAPLLVWEAGRVIHRRGRGFTGEGAVLFAVVAVAAGLAVFWRLVH